MLTKPEIQLDMKPTLKTERFPLPELAFILILAVGLRFWYGSFIIDDAYITFRYATNAVNGIGFVFNPLGQHVLATTTPLFALLITLFKWMGFTPEGTSLWLSILSDCATINLLYLFARHMGAPKIGLIACVLVALMPDYLNYAVSGMETSLYVALLMGSLYLYLRQNYALTGLVMALLVLTRPDGLLMVVVLFGDYLIKRRRIPWRMGFAFSPLLLVWVVFATLYFGSPISHSVVAKAALPATSPGESFLNLVIFLFQKIKPVLTLFALLGIFAILRSQNFKQFRLPLVWWGLYAFVFVAEGAFHFFSWYYIPLMPFYFLFALIGLFGIGRTVAEAISKDSIKKMAGIGVGIVAVLAFVGLFWLALANRQELADSQATREVLYRDVATRLLSNLGREEQVALNEAGTMGYFCQCQVFDITGLTSPEALGRTELQNLQTVRPLFIVAYNNHLSKATLNSDWLNQNYEKVETHPVTIYGHSELYVFRRRN